MLQRHRLEPEHLALETADPDAPGWSRRRCGRGWMFLNTNGGRLSGDHRERCDKLAIPPAWRSVWISPSPTAHIQARGEDDAGRRQYIYHQHWREACEAAKFADLPLFADRLPRLRKRVAGMLGSEVAEDVALAGVVRLLDQAGLRIGRHRRGEGPIAIGATTLEARHCKVDGDTLAFSYRAKGGRVRDVALTDHDLSTAVARLLGETTADDDPVFDVEGFACTARQVNDFIAEATGERFSAKDFRTWGGSVAAARALRGSSPPTVSTLAEAASDWLGNTPAVARSSYIHPALIDRAIDRRLIHDQAGPTRLRVDERACYAAIKDWKSSLPTTVVG